MLEIAEKLSEETGCEMILGFTEFCAPTLGQAFDKGASFGALRVVVTPMMTPGGEHSEVDIPEAIVRARKSHPDVEFFFAWPFDTCRTVRFLGETVKIFI